MYVSPACRDLQSSGKCVWSPRTGVMGSCETLCGRCQTGGLWQERQVLLTARLLFVPPTNNLSWEFLVCSSAVSVPQWQSQPPPWGPCICWVVLSWSPSSGYRGNICAVTTVTSVQQLLSPPSMKLKQGWSSSWVKVKGHFRQSSRGLGSVLGGD